MRRINNRHIARVAALAVTIAVPGSMLIGGATPAFACLFSTPDSGARPACGAPGTGIQLTATPSTTGPGDPVTVTATRYGTDYTADTTFTIDSGSCVGNICTPTTPGTATIFGSYRTAVITTTVNVLAPAGLRISPVYTQAYAGDKVAYTVSRITSDGTVIDDDTARATVTLDGVVCPDHTCPATTVGEHIVTATDGDLTGGGALMVLAGSPAKLVVTPHVSGYWNNAVPAWFTTEAYDAGGNDLGDVTADTTFTVAPDGTCSGNTCTAASAGAHTVTATDGAASGSVSLDAVAPQPTVAPSLPDGQVGAWYSHTVLSWRDDTTVVSLAAASTLPPGLKLSAEGVLRGKPTAVGTYRFNVVAQNATGSQNKSTTIIINPGAPSKPTLSIGDVTTAEGDSGRTLVQLPVTLSAPATSRVTVKWHTSSGSAKSGSDYVAAHGTLTLTAGETSGVVTVAVKGDKRREPNEHFRVVLTRPHGATLARARGTVTVTNDD